MQTLTAEFLGKEITLVDNNGIAYVAMREVVEGIGLAWKPQYQKLMDHSQKFSCYHMTTTAEDILPRTRTRVLLTKLIIPV